MKQFYVMEKGKIPEYVLIPKSIEDEERALNLVKMKFHKNYVKGSFEVVTYVATNEEFNTVIKCPLGTTPKEALEAVNNNREDPNEENLFTDIKVLEKNKHICKYCGSITEGEYENILCSDCRECFGHTLYSEL